MNALLDLILVDLYECDHDRLLDADLVREGMLKAAELIDASCRKKNSRRLIKNEC